MRRIAFVMIVFIMMGCVNSVQNNLKFVEKEKTNFFCKEYKTKTNKTFVVYEDKSLGASISLLKIESRNFEVANDTFNLGEVDPIDNIFVEDLDKNGFDELYVVTRSAGSGSYSTIYGFASNNDKSVTPIYVSGISESNLNGYRGHNSFSVVNGSLVNSFPVFKEEDTNANPTNGTRKIRYELLAGEAGWVIKPTEIIY